jgi:hypothetical protein
VNGVVRCETIEIQDASQTRLGGCPRVAPSHNVLWRYVCWSVDCWRRWGSSWAMARAGLWALISWLVLKQSPFEGTDKDQRRGGPGLDEMVYADANKENDRFAGDKLTHLRIVRMGFLFAGLGLVLALCITSGMWSSLLERGRKKEWHPSLGTPWRGNGNPPGSEQTKGIRPTDLDRGWHNLKELLGILAGLPILGIILGFTTACLFAPNRFYKGPIGRKWLRFIGVRQIAIARFVCFCVLSIAIAIILFFALI